MNRKKINDRNRKFGKSVENQVAKVTGGYRVPLSGAVKSGPHNLTGDVAVQDLLDRDFVKIECKGTSVVTPKGEKTFTLKKSVIEQAFNEARYSGELGVVWVHWKNNQYEDDHVMIAGDTDKQDIPIIPARMFLDLLELAKIGRLVLEKGCICDECSDEGER